MPHAPPSVDESSEAYLRGIEIVLRVGSAISRPRSSEAYLRGIEMQPGVIEATLDGMV